MLYFDVRSLAANAATVDGELAVDDDVWLPEDVRPDTPLRVTGRVSVAGNDRFYFHGHIAGSVTVDCKRCLTPVTVNVSEEASAIFSNDESEDEGDPDVFPLAEGGTRVDIRPAIREVWLLNVPAFVLCREDCLGICPTCGSDRNTGTCSCVPETDRRWDALRALRTEAD